AASADDFDRALDEPSLTIERFLGALLQALGPFSRMLSDLLALFERAGARTTDASLRINFDFDNAPPLSFDLRHFRDWLSSLQKVRELVAVREWSPEVLWRLHSALQVPSHRSEFPGTAGTPAERWGLEYVREGRFFVPELPPPSSGDGDLDELLGEAFRLWSTVMRATVAIARSRDELRSQARGAGAESGAWSARLLDQLHSDAWGASIIGRLYRVADLARDHPTFAVDARDRLRNLFAGIPTVSVERERVLEVLLAFLNLPAWQWRYELYSAWVFTLIAEALEARQLRIHHAGGRLSFSFGGSHLATADQGTPKLHVWAELRSPLAEPSSVSERRAIQPDYTLVADPVTDTGSAVAVVECKQYRKHSKRNFLHAVVDYANGRPNAAIFLASYGPARRDMLDGLPPEMTARIHLFGDLRPHDDARRGEFRDSLRAAIDRWYGALPAPRAATRIPIATGAPRVLEQVSLSWGASPSDLDLHVAVRHEGRWTEIDFRTRGSRDAFPWAQLDRDATSGYGPETIEFAQVLDATYRCFVVNYSNDTPLADSVAGVRVQHDGTAIAIDVPVKGSGRYWHVFDFDGSTGRLEIANRLSDQRPVPEATPAT
ncbi:MAG TPA: hypothetical protein VEU30_07405, partial [Thermoanaerobaculia bacterium]|nr:hypothetical protein [Thermoanaerobaculia bacterium]